MTCIVWTICTYLWSMSTDLYKNYWGKKGLEEMSRRVMRNDMPTALKRWKDGGFRYQLGQRSNLWWESILLWPWFKVIGFGSKWHLLPYLWVLNDNVNMSWTWPFKSCLQLLSNIYLASSLPLATSIHLFSFKEWWLVN